MRPLASGGLAPIDLSRPRSSNKRLFAVAAATTLSGSVQAQSTSVTLYGLIDTGISYTNVDGAYTNAGTGRWTSVDNSRIGATTGTTAGSRWGLLARKTWATACTRSFNWNRVLIAATATRCKAIACSAARPPWAWAAPIGAKFA